MGLMQRDLILNLSKMTTDPNETGDIIIFIFIIIIFS